MSDLTPGSLYAFSNLARDSTNCVLFTDKVFDTTGSINNACAISSFQKTIAGGCFYDYFDKCPT